MVGGSEEPVNREIEFILACLRCSLRGDSLPPAVSGLDLEQVRVLADRHAVTPLLKELFPDNFRQIAGFNLALGGVLVRLLNSFARQGIDVVPLKGPMLDQTLYGNLALRAFGDLDLLVRKADVLHAKHLLESEGYQLRSTLHWATDSACFRVRDSELSFSRTNTNVNIDLHWHLLPRYFPSPFHEDRVWRRLRTLSFAGVTTSTLSTEDLLLFLCAHGTKHLWERLGWICDVGRLVQVERVIDWSYVLEQAEGTGTSRMLTLGLLVASDLLGTELPPLAANHVATDKLARALSKTIRDRLMANAASPALAVDAALLSTRVFEYVGHRLRFVFGLFIQPSEADYRILQLPPALYWLYYPFRFLRLTAKYSGRWTKSIVNLPRRWKCLRKT